MIFPLWGCKLMFGNGPPTIGSHFQAHFICYFIKRTCKPTKFLKKSFDSEFEIPAGALYPHALLDVSLSSLNRVLGRTCTFTRGESSGFICFWAPEFHMKAAMPKAFLPPPCGSKSSITANNGDTENGKMESQYLSKKRPRS